MDKDYKYTVCTQCWTFNHAPYIVDAMNSFTMQETTFPVVTVIVDDCSTDGEQDIIRKYLDENFEEPFRMEETEYAHIICAHHKTNPNCQFVVLFLRFNHYSIKKPKPPYLTEWLDNAKYHAICEGDDYWTDSNKLQKQVDYMEQATDVTLCFHNAIAHWEDGSKLDAPFSKIENRYYYYYDEVFSAFIVPTASILHRSWIIHTELYHKVFTNPKRIVGDWPLLLVCAAMGKIRGISDCMSVYRRTQTGYTLSIGSNTIPYNIKAADMNYEFYKIFPRPYCIPCRYKTINYSFGAYSASKGTGHVRYDMILKSFRRFPLHSFLYVLKVILKKMLRKPLY